MVIVRVQNDDNDNIPAHLTNDNINPDVKLKLCKILKNDIFGNKVINYEKKVEILNNKMEYRNDDQTINKINHHGHQFRFKNSSVSSASRVTEQVRPFKQCNKFSQNIVTDNKSNRCEFVNNGSTRQNDKVPHRRNYPT